MTLRHSIRKNHAGLSFSLFQENYLVYSLLLKTTASNLCEIGLSDWSNEKKKKKLCLDFDLVFLICFQKLAVIFFRSSVSKIHLFGVNLVQHLILLLQDRPDYLWQLSPGFQKPYFSCGIVFQLVDRLVSRLLTCGFETAS